MITPDNSSEADRKVQRITTEQYADPRTLPTPAWYWIPTTADFVGHHWFRRVSPFSRLAVVVATHYHPDQPDAPQEVSGEDREFPQLSAAREEWMKRRVRAEGDVLVGAGSSGITCNPASPAPSKETIAREATREIHPWLVATEGEGTPENMQEGYDENEANIREDVRIEAIILRALDRAGEAKGADNLHWAGMKALRRAFVETLAPIYTDTLLDDFGTGKQSSAHLRWMCKELLSKIDVFPVDKTGRWIGYIQGVLACHGKLDVEEERNRTRPLFQKAYALLAVPAPPASVDAGTRKEEAPCKSETLDREIARIIAERNFYKEKGTALTAERDSLAEQLEEAKTRIGEVERLKDAVVYQRNNADQGLALTAAKLAKAQAALAEKEKESDERGLAAVAAQEIAKVLNQAVIDTNVQWAESVKEYESRLATLEADKRRLEERK